MVSFNDLMGNFLLAGLIFLGIFGLIVAVQQQNNAPDPLTNNPLFGGENGSYNQLQQEISSIQRNASIQYNISSEEPVPRSEFGIVLFSIVGAGKTFGSFTLGFFTIFVKLPVTVLGIDPSILNIITTWLIVIIITALWLLYKLGGA